MAFLIHHSSQYFPNSLGFATGYWGIGPEHVSLSPASEDQGWVEPLIDLFSQVSDIDCHEIVRDIIVFIVQMLHEHIVRDHLAAIQGEQLQEPVFRRRQFDHLPAPTDDMCCGIDLKVITPQYGILLPMSPAQKRPESGEQYIHIDRFSQIVIGTRIESSHLIRHTAFCREQQNMHGDPIRSPLLQEGKPIDFRKHDVEDDRIVGRTPTLHIGVFAIERGINSKPFLLQTLAERFHQRKVVFNE
jgi:hypothetical protein